MIELRLLGRLSLTSAAGRDVRALLGQPRRLALLAYLAAATPPGFHRRDSLLALFWPELDQRSEEHTSELQSPCNLVCRLLLEKKKHAQAHRRSSVYPYRPLPLCPNRVYPRP